MPKSRNPKSWAECISLRARYKRSVHLERDVGETSSLDGYLITPLVHKVTARVAAGLSAATPARAWSLTGPYGSGKSAFGLFLANLLGDPGDSRTKIARELVKRHDRALYGQLFGVQGRKGIFLRKEGLYPVLVTGERRSLEEVMVGALANAIERFPKKRGKRPDAFVEAEKAAQRLQKGKVISAREVIALYEDVARAVRKGSGEGKGLLVILDEAGKTLEYAASSRSRGDVQLLQELAEAANRSGENTIVFIAMLHQAFEQYAGQLSVSQRNEWAKVQGRFEDVPFRESSDQVLRLIGAALGDASLPASQRKAVKDLAQEVADLANVPDSSNDTKLAGLLEKTAPLHPMTALCLGPLFRSRFAQNERSLFAFLGALEPKGFQEFLGERRPEHGAWPLYAADQLYDYVFSTFGGRLYGHHGRQWAQTEEALRRLPQDAVELDSRIVKIVGLLTALGESTGLRPSENLIVAALKSSGSYSLHEIHGALHRLVQASILIYRKFKDAYQLWDGSDLDVEALTRKAMDRSADRNTLVDRLMRVAPLRPLIASRHFFKTGTLRYFDFRYTDESICDRLSDDSNLDADGILWLVIPTSESVADQVRERLSQPMIWPSQSGDKKPMVVALPRQLKELRELASELGAFENVLTGTPELQDDPVARREVEGRIAESSRSLRVQLASLSSGEARCDWYVGGKTQDIDSPRALARLLSDLCDEAYSKAPWIHNELLNRRHLSSTSAAARRNILEAMIERAERERLGFEGFPPEISMYRSLLERHGLHKKSGDTWEFSAPKQGEGTLWDAWNAIEKVLGTSEIKHVSIEKIYDQLKAPPFGLKDGVLPILVTAFMLQGESELALYEENVFVPRLTAPVIERLLKSPAKFSLQRFQVTGSRRDLFRELAVMLVEGEQAPQATLLQLVRQLVRMVSDLSCYATHTKTLSGHALAVRDTLLRAREPGPLLFHDLPEACGFASFQASGAGEKRSIKEFVAALRLALMEIRQADKKLDERIEKVMTQTFAVGSGGEGLRRELALRAERLLPVVVDPRLKSLCARLADGAPDHRGWLVSLATLLAGKPPESWNDQDFEQMRALLAVLGRQFATFEDIAGLGGGIDSGYLQTVRISVTQPGVAEKAKVLTLGEGEQRDAEVVRERLLAEVRAHSAELSKSAILAGLSQVAEELIEELEQERTRSEAKDQA